MTLPDDLALFSTQEVAEGLARLSTRENGEEIARLVDLIPQSERPFYRWSHEAVLLASSVGLEVAERVRRHYGRDDESRARIADQQKEFGVDASNTRHLHRADLRPGNAGRRVRVD